MPNNDSIYCKCNFTSEMNSWGYTTRSATLNTKLQYFTKVLHLRLERSPRFPEAPLKLTRNPQVLPLKPEGSKSMQPFN